MVVFFKIISCDNGILSSESSIREKFLSSDAYDDLEINVNKANGHSTESMLTGSSCISKSNLSSLLAAAATDELPKKYTVHSDKSDHLSSDTKIFSDHNNKHGSVTDKSGSVIEKSKDALLEDLRKASKQWPHPEAAAAAVATVRYNSGNTEGSNSEFSHRNCTADVFRQALNRLNMVMATCFLCNFTQTILLLLDYSLGYVTEDTPVGPPFFYWTFYSWFPQWGIVCSLLYLARYGMNNSAHAGEQTGSDVRSISGPFWESRQSSSTMQPGVISSVHPSHGNSLGDHSLTSSQSRILQVPSCNEALANLNP